jgi:hypothetical protein
LPAARPREWLDAGVAIAADKGPYFQAGVADPASGGIPDAPVGEPGTAVIPPAQIPADVLKTELAASFRNVPEWSAYNSRNHQGTGQNVLFNDTHVEFWKHPLAGEGHDNIYTIQRSGVAMRDALFGVRPADFRGPLHDGDSVIVP